MLALIGVMRGPGFRLPWRAKLAHKPCRNRWQLQRVNLIAFQAPKRARPFTRALRVPGGASATL
jgi:hypothetical protein